MVGHAFKSLASQQVRSYLKITTSILKHQIVSNDDRGVCKTYYSIQHY